MHVELEYEGRASAMTTTMRELGIDRMSVAERVELAHDIWESLEDEAPGAALSAEDIAELERRDEAFDDEKDPATDWAEIRKRIEEGA